MNGWLITSFVKDYSLFSAPSLLCCLLLAVMWQIYCLRAPRSESVKWPCVSLSVPRAVVLFASCSRRVSCWHWLVVLAASCSVIGEYRCCSPMRPPIYHALKISISIRQCSYLLLLPH